MENTLSTIQQRKARVAIVGLGYVGLPLAVETAKNGFQTIGLDLSFEKVDQINRGINYIKDVNEKDLRALVQSGKLSASTDFSKLKDCQFISVCVPTPLGKGKSPDISYIIQAITEVKRYLHKGQVVILESTTYPGTTEEVVLPLLEESGFKCGVDFHLAFSPERIDPGNRQFVLKNTPKIIGGITAQCTEIATSFYQTFIDRVIPVSSTRSAEMVKILENTFRAINIGLANEIAIMCNHLKIDTWEVIDAAASKPFGFMPFYPGPGLGGHCIPVDPHYLLWKLRSMNYTARFIQLADEINSSMPHLVAAKISDALNSHSKSVKGSRILIIGVSYKADIDDCRESPALDVIDLLLKKEALVSYHDPHVPHIRVNGVELASVPIEGETAKYDCAALLTNHSAFDIKRIVEQSRILVDTRNATRGLNGYANKIIKI